MAVALQILASGFAAGAVDGLVAVGHSLVFRLTGVVHFAFGELIALGVFVTLLVAAGSGPVSQTSVGGGRFLLALAIGLLVTAAASAGAYVTSKPTATELHIVVPLHVTGTIGAHKVDTIVEGSRLIVRADGPVRLTVMPAIPERLLNDSTSGLSGRQLLERAARAALTLARMRQYETYLGNPDPSGPNRTTYVYRSAARPLPPPVAVVAAPKRAWAAPIAVAAGLLLAAAAGLVVWSRS